MASHADDRQSPDRREFLKTAGALTGGAVIYQNLDGIAYALEPALAQRAAMPASGVVRPFALTEVALILLVMSLLFNIVARWLVVGGSARSAAAH